MQWARELIAVAAGGAVGAASRHLIAQATPMLLGRGLPWGTLVVNVVGSLLIGVSYVPLIERAVANDAWRLAIVVGFIGALTTFSTFALDTLTLLQQGSPVRAGINILANVVICLAAAWAGLVVSRYLFTV